MFGLVYGLRNGCAARTQSLVYKRLGSLPAPHPAFQPATTAMYYGLYCLTSFPVPWGAYNYHPNRTQELPFRPRPGCEFRSILGLINDPDPHALTDVVGSGLDYYKAHATNPDP